MISVKTFKLLLAVLSVLTFLSTGVSGEEPATKLNEVEVVADSQTTEPQRQLPATEGAKIYEARKTSQVNLDEIPAIATNNYREAFTYIPGLFVSEVSNESIASINYRGIGDPHESFNLMILKDGVSIAADPYGYPAVYYQPPLSSLEKIEFIRGGSALLYGPQAGGALNFITRKPPEDESTPRFLTEQIIGSESLYQTYNEISGKSGDVGYLTFLNFRTGDGYRRENSDFRALNAGVRVSLDSSPITKWLLDVDLYDSDHGEPGGLTTESGPGLANLFEDREQTTLPFDRLRIERYVPKLAVKVNPSSDLEINGSVWGGQYYRFTRRQDLGAGIPFGGYPLGTTNTIQLQEFRTIGAEVRSLYRWELFDQEQQLSGGIYTLATSSPFRQESGDNPSANTGILKRLLYRENVALSAFVENAFHFGDLKIVPGVRVENIFQDIKEDFNSDPTAPLREADESTTVPLFGLGVGYDLASAAELYGNISQSYKPKTFQDFVPLQTGDQISEDLDEAKALNLEVGIRGEISKLFNYDVSLFDTVFDNQFGRVGPVVQNTGRARYQGVDAGFEAGLVSIADTILDTTYVAELGDLKIHANGSFLDAHFTEGPLNEKTPQYAPDFLIRAGVKYEYNDRLSLALLRTEVGDHYADDGNSANRLINHYGIWDLLGEVDIIKGTLSAQAGVNNLSDLLYAGRIRNTGLDIAPPRNYFVGLTARF